MGRATLDLTANSYVSTPSTKAAIGAAAAKANFVPQSRLPGQKTPEDFFGTDYSIRPHADTQVGQDVHFDPQRAGARRGVLYQTPVCGAGFGTKPGGKFVEWYEIPRGAGFRAAGNWGITVA